MTKKKKKGKFPQLGLPEKIKKWIEGGLLIFLALILTLSFFDLAGIAGQKIFSLFKFLVGKTVFISPLILFISGLVFFFTQYQKFFWPLILSIFLFLFGISGLLYLQIAQGGWIGYLIALPFLKLFGSLVSKIILTIFVIISSLVFWHLLKPPAREETRPEVKNPSLIRKIFGTPRFKIKEVEPKIKEIPAKVPELKVKEIPQKTLVSEYQMPPLELLEAEKGQPSAGDIRQNSAIIKKTLESFEIPVEMAEVNIGPTVTQYTLKPADGIKLSKITSLSNDLALALASHPIRIEAPIPGKSLVGIEVPNKLRTLVRLRDLILNPQFQKSPSGLTFGLGRDVSGHPVYADLARMPHLLVAGSTGTGKTIFLNSLILSLLYRNSPEILGLILVDPKRVEFPIYNDLPHLLCPVIYDAQKTIKVLEELIKEMEMRFDMLAEVKARDIAGYNQLAAGGHLTTLNKPMPYIVLIIDELADLMAARGREIEAGIVRLAQMARAVGIHLVVATQRPSVEVITGLIKANITSRITFQLASQVDSRTVLDMAGAEKLLGLGDLLFVSAEISKPKRIQGSYVSEKEVKRVVNWIKSKTEVQKLKPEKEASLENRLAENLAETLEMPESEGESFYLGEDPLYEEAKRVVIEARKASASLLQRKLRIGYARAARLIDILEERGVVGPSQGAKPRQVLIKTEEENEGWQKL